MRSLWLCALIPLASASPFCMCPNGQPGQAVTCPPPPEPKCPRKCENRDVMYNNDEMYFPTFPPIDTKNLFGGFTLPTIPPGMNLFPNLFTTSTSEPRPWDTTTQETPTAPPPPPPTPPPPPQVPQGNQMVVNPTLAPYIQKMPIGVQPSQMGPYPQMPFSQSGASSIDPNQRMMTSNNMMTMTDERNYINQFNGVQHGMGEWTLETVNDTGARQFTGVGSATDSPMMERQILTGRVNGEDTMEVQPKTFSIYENEKNKGYRQPVKRAADEVSMDKCNDERLRKIILENVDTNPSTSKRAIQRAASEQIGGLFDVVCSTHDFSYLANTQLFCEAGNDDVTCFAFLHTLLQ